MFERTLKAISDLFDAKGDPLKQAVLERAARDINGTQWSDPEPVPDQMPEEIEPKPIQPEGAAPS